MKKERKMRKDKGPTPKTEINMFRCGKRTEPVSMDNYDMETYEEQSDVDNLGYIG